MVLKLMLAPLIIARCAARAGFVAGAVAGTAGVVGLCALRRAMRDRRHARAET